MLPGSLFGLELFSFSTWFSDCAAKVLGNLSLTIARCLQSISYVLIMSHIRVFKKKILNIIHCSKHSLVVFHVKLLIIYVYILKKQHEYHVS